MNTKKQDHFIWLGLSLSIHLFVLACIFISLTNKPLLMHKPLKKKIAFKVPAPIVFYGQQTDTNKAAGSLTQTHQLSPQPVQQSSTAATPNKQEEKKITEKQLAPAIKKSPVIDKKPLLPENKKKEPTLADMFNQARQNFKLPQKSNLQTDGQGAGSPLVIREGDIKYYSLWSAFLKHLNNAARFNRVKNPVPLAQWISHKLIKNHLQCGITVNKKGEVQDIDIILSSGYEPYDKLCIQDIWSASPFPPLGDQLGKNSARFEVRTHI